MQGRRRTGCWLGLGFDGRHNNSGFGADFGASLGFRVCSRACGFSGLNCQLPSAG